MKNNTLSLSYTLPKSKDTMDLGAQIGSLCPSLCIIFLEGPLGGGKTTFAQGLIQRLSATQRVKSPTYTLLEQYATPVGPILHFDLYRLHTPLELENIGIRDYMAEKAIWLVEWPEKAVTQNGVVLLPSPDLCLSFSFASHYHHITLTAKSAVGNILLNQLKLKKPNEN